MISIDKFSLIIENTPLVSLDFIIKDQNAKILLGRRVNKPAKDFLFTLGGRVYKNETLNEAQKRILKEEAFLDVDKYTLKFLGVFEHFYDDSFVNDKISTHYINLAYEVNINHLHNLPTLQHNEYVWFSLSELMNSSFVHHYVKEYFKIKEDR